MEENSNWKSNEKSIVNNANDWRSHHEPNLRNEVLSNIVKRLKRLFPNYSIDQAKDTALKIEETTYGIAIDKDDYMLKFFQWKFMIEREYRNVQSGSSVKGTNTLEPEAEAQELLPQQKQSQQPQNTNYMFQHQVNSNQLPHPHHPFAGFSAVSTQEPEQDEIEKLITQGINALATQNNGELQGAFTGSFQGMAQQNTIPCGEFGNFDVYGSSFLSIQGQEVGESQPMVYQWQHMEQLPLHNGSLEPHFDESQRFQAAGGEEWQEETYQKIQALKKMSLPFLSTILQKYVEKSWEIDSLPRKKGLHKEIESLRKAKSSLEQVIVFLNVDRSRVSEKHRDNLALWEKQLRRWIRIKKEPRNPMHQQKPEANQQLQMPTSHETHEINIKAGLLPTPLDQQILGDSPFDTPSPVLGDPENTMSLVSHSHQFQTVAQEHPAFTLPPDQDGEWTVDSIPGSFQSSEESRARRKVRMQAKRVRTTHEEPRMKRSITSQTQGNSTPLSSFKVNKIEPGFGLLQEINQINARLKEPSVQICNEDVHLSEVTSGTIVKCSYESGQISPIKPLSLLILEDYPFSDPLILETSVYELEDLSSRTRSRFDLCFKELSKPIYVTEIAQIWDDCARATLVEYAGRYGGGTFSSK